MMMTYFNGDVKAEDYLNMYMLGFTAENSLC
jgi:hypothetical protein